MHPYASIDEVDVSDDYLFHKTLLGGDQLTCAHVCGCHKARTSEENDLDRLQGLVPVAEDWHAKMCLLEVCCLFSLSLIVFALPALTYIILEQFIICLTK